MRTGRNGISFWEVVITCALAALLVVLVLPAIQRSRSTGSVQTPAKRCALALAQLGLALHNYHDDYGSFPPVAGRYGPDDTAQSWRVLILPYVDKAGIYDEFDFEEPWDGPHNRTLHNQLAGRYEFHRCLGNHDDTAPIARTHYLAVIGEHTAWRADRAVTLDKITDGAERTILLVEAANSAINWFEPQDLLWDALSFKINDPNSPSPGSRHTQKYWVSDDRPYINVLLADGSVRKLPADTPPDVLKALLTINGGEDVGDPWLP